MAIVTVQSIFVGLPVSREVSLIYVISYITLHSIFFTTRSVICLLNQKFLI